MKLNRKTAMKKLQRLEVRLTPAEYRMVKVLATERGWTMTRVAVDALRDYFKAKT